MTCPHCLHGRTIAVPDSGSYYFRAPRDEEEMRHAEPCECCSVCAGCDELVPLVAEVEEGGYCAACSARLVAFAMKEAC